MNTHQHLYTGIILKKICWPRIKQSVFRSHYPIPKTQPYFPNADEQEWGVLHSLASGPKVFRVGLSLPPPWQRDPLQSSCLTTWNQEQTQHAQGS